MSQKIENDLDKLKKIPDKVLNALDNCLLVDRWELGKNACKIKKSINEKKENIKELNELEKRFKQSQEIYNIRKNLIPAIIYPDNLPVVKKREEIIKAIKKNQVLIIAGATGSGKTTQLPKMCLEAGLGRRANIAVTQPRRIAAYSIAERVALELNTSLGEGVGYQVRFQNKTNYKTLIKFMTDGILLNEIQQYKNLENYDAVILDEAHERNLNIDFLLGYLKNILPKRPELKLIISSATIDVERFSKYFKDAPIISVEGITYPVDVRYRPPNDDEDEDPDLPLLIMKALEEVTNELDTGDILVFLASEADIKETAEFLQKANRFNAEILPLFARLSQEEQKKIFINTKKRKIILSTNISETSLTIPGIRAVIDAGLARVKRVSDKSAAERLQIEKISQASANQRKGRAGRVAPGICIRLYSEEDFKKRQEFTDPEIKRSSLAAVILQMQMMGLGKIEEFDFIEPPQDTRIRQGYHDLIEVGAMDSKKSLTHTGKEMINLPLEPRFAKILLTAKKLNVIEPALIIVAMLAIQDPRERPINKRLEADCLHRRFEHEKSDFMGWLKLWEFYENAVNNLPSKNKLRKFCKENFLNYLRMQEWRQVCLQLKETINQENKIIKKCDVNSEEGYQLLHTALIAGLLSKIGKKTEDGHYLAARGVKFFLWPGSGVSKAYKKNKEPGGNKNQKEKKYTKGPEWIVASELVETSKMFARGIAEINPLWVESVAKHLVKKSYSEPYYDEKNGFVRAKEKVEIYGLPIVQGRKVYYGNIDPEIARDVFIREALVEEKLKSNLEFYQKNLDMIEDVKNLTQKSRQELLVPQEVIFEFYKKALPKNINNDKELKDYIFKENKENIKNLLLTKEHLLAHSPSNINAARFPDKINYEGREYNIKYVFNPTAIDDGVSLLLPITDINSIKQEKLDWLVPGLLPSKIVNILRGLPKAIRKAFNPLPDTAENIAEKLKFLEGDFYKQLAKELTNGAGEKIDENILKNIKIPAHLVFNLKIINEKKQVIAEDKEIKNIQRKFKEVAKNVFENIEKNNYEKNKIIEWNFDDLPEKILLNKGVGALAYPAIVDEGKCVAIKLFNDQEEAENIHRKGVIKLAILTLDKYVKKLEKTLSLPVNVTALFAALGGKTDQINIEIIRAAMEEMIKDKKAPRKKIDFMNLVDKHKQIIHALGNEIYMAVKQAYLKAGNVLIQVIKYPTPAHKNIYLDIQEQLETLLAPITLKQLNAKQLLDLPRFVNAAEKRIEKLQYNLAKDKVRLDEIQPYLIKYRMAKKQNINEKKKKKILNFRWLIEEWRVNLFHQEAGNRIKVNKKILDDSWIEIENNKPD